MAMANEKGIGYQVPALVRNVLGAETEIPWARICEIVQPIEDAIKRAAWLSTDEGLQFDITPESAQRQAAYRAAQAFIPKQKEQGQ